MSRRPQVISNISRPGASGLINAPGKIANSAILSANANGSRKLTRPCINKHRCERDGDGYYGVIVEWTAAQDHRTAPRGSLDTGSTAAVYLDCSGCPTIIHSEYHAPAARGFLSETSCRFILR
jgi:hypothetical protein